MEELLLLPQLLLKIFITLVVISLCSLSLHFYIISILNPRKLRSKLIKQGIRGPAPSSFIYGNIPDMKRIQSSKFLKTSSTAEQNIMNHDYFHKLFSYFELWGNEYGPVFTYSTGNVQIIYVSKPEIVKEISLWTSLDLGKPSFLKRDRGPLLGQGIFTSNGSLWVHQRKIIAPEFFMEKVKGMMNLMVDSATNMLKLWESEVHNEGGVADIRVDLDLRNFSADIISRACFGSSYIRGKEIFTKLRALQQIMAIQGLHMGVPGLRHLPTKNNRDLWKLEKEIALLILKVVKERREAKSENDLLQMILEGANSVDSGLDNTDQFIVDNCKNIYFAGHETTATSASWILVLLAASPEWQSRVRAEVENICAGSLPDFSMLRKMKTLTMVIHEALRLYPPAAFLTREAFQDITISDMQVPKGTNIWIPIIKLHQDPKIWGPDAHEFNPDRFSRGIAGACKAPQAYVPFGIGPRTCLGQNFAMVELKILMCLILSKFSFTISPKYRHSPAFRLVIEPEHGVDLVIKRT
ncbi:hypothetical protein C5167_045421 [Papaver somniferum]|uniref:Cytochrome P450 n=1 Tax=Papaver somniferum TaxID=3469 RepID=A0A4Y7LEN7_PAPSO|nr:cytochrome P450 714C2-like [Papaver somniferum]RZC82635.1 hypothetical protein C5167_045421 [Papaver somniferum]